MRLKKSQTVAALIKSREVMIPRDQELGALGRTIRFKNPTCNNGMWGTHFKCP